MKTSTDVPHADQPHCRTPLAISSQITFQGTLKQNGVPVNTNKNMQFSFVDGPAASIPGTVPIALANVQVTNGLIRRAVADRSCDQLAGLPALHPGVGRRPDSESQSAAHLKPVFHRKPDRPGQRHCHGQAGRQRGHDCEDIRSGGHDRQDCRRSCDDGADRDGSCVERSNGDRAVTYGNLDSATVQPYLVPQNAIVMFPGACPTGWQVYGHCRAISPWELGGAMKLSPGRSGGAPTHTHAAGSSTLATRGPIDAGCYAGLSESRREAAWL